MNKLPKLCKFCIFTVLAILCAAIAAGCGRTVDGESAGSMYTVSGAERTGGKDVLNVPTDTETFDIMSVITVAEGYEISVSYDLNGKRKTPATAPLSFGDNKFYVTITGEEVEVYELIVHRNRLFKFVFDLNGGEGNIPDQTVEEGALVSVPETEPERLGYDFGGWDFDFTQKASSSQYIKAVWIQKTDIPYKLKVFISEDGAEYVPAEQFSMTYNDGLTGSRVYADMSVTESLNTDYELMENISNTEAVVACDGSTELKLYYNRLYAIRGEVNLRYDTANEDNVSAELVSTEEEKSYTLDVTDGIISGQAVSGKYTLKVAAGGYVPEERTVNVTSEADLGAFTFDVYDFGAITVNGNTVLGSAYETNEAGVEYIKGEKGTGAWKMDAQSRAVQMPGNSDTPLYFAGFASENYFAGANIILKIISDNTMLADWSQRIAGIVITDGIYELGIYMISDGIRIIDGSYWDNRFVTCSGFGINFQQNVDENRGYRFMCIERGNGILTVSIDGEAVLRLSASKGAEALWDNATYTYSDVGSGEAFSEQKLKSMLAELLGDGRKNGVGLGGMYNEDGSNNMMFDSYFVTTDTVRGNELAKGLTRFVSNNAVTIDGQRRGGVTVNGKVFANAAEYAYIGTGSAVMKDGAYAYDVETETLFNNAGKQDKQNRNHIYMNEVMSGNYVFGADVDLSESSYYQAGITISDGKNSIYVGQFAENTGVCVNYYTSQTQGVADNRTTIKNIGVTGLTSGNNKSVIKRFEIERQRRHKDIHNGKRRKRAGDARA